MNNDTATLAGVLTKAGYAALFSEPGHEKRLDDAWNNAPQEVFERLAGERSAPSLARFLSSCILTRKDILFLSRADLTSLAEVYTDALEHNYTGKMVDWGFLKSNEDTGVEGSLFLLMGEPAMSALSRLLDNWQEVEYIRPEPDVSGFDRTRLQKIRIRDFAALYISKIRNIPITFSIPFGERDAAIERLQARLREE